MSDEQRWSGARRQAAFICSLSHDDEDASATASPTARLIMSWIQILLVLKSAPSSLAFLSPAT